MTTLYAYDAQGQLSVTALDIDRDGVIDYNGKDRVTRTTRTFTTAHGTNVERTVQEVWATDDSDVATTIHVSERSLDGLQSWSTQGTLVTQRIEAPGANGWDGNWSVTTIYPDDSAMVETYTNGRLASQVRTDANNVVIGRTDILYDAHGRVWKTTDGRNATTVQTYEQQANPVAGGHPVTADLVLTVQTPPKETGGTGPITTFHYDAMGRSDLVTDTLGGTTTTAYFPSGKVQSSGGSRAYPISYTYTPQGRLATMTTTTAAGPSVTTWVYHPTSGLLQEKKYAGVTAYTQTFKPSGRLWTRTNARSVITTYDFFDSGELETIDYADSTPDVAFTYTRLGQLKTTTSGGSTITASPNVFGQVETESWSGGDLDGVNLTRSLEVPLRRFNGLTVTRSGATLTSHTIGYDDASRVKTITLGTASATYAYIPQTSLLDSVTYKQGGTTFATADHDFDLAGHLKWIKYTNAASAPLLGSEYTVDDIHRRTKVTREDGTSWDWGYNARSEVNSASRKFADATPAPMEQFSYTFDDIGNRLTSTAAGRTGAYVPNTKNQYASRTNPGYVRVSGEADFDANVVINAELPEGRKGKEFWREQAVSNSAAGVLAPVRVLAAKPHGGAGGVDIAAIESGHRYVPPAAENFSHDDDGNLTDDARWTYTWDAENRLTSAEERSAGIPARPAELPRLRLEFKYDAASRRTGKKVYTRNTADTAWDVKSNTLFIWDGWNMVAELESGATGPVALRRTYVWGLDISGTLSGTGGVGGLVFESQYASTSPHALSATLAPCYDGNGNVIGLLNTTTGVLDARYEYDAFGNTLRATGVAANANPIRFSTKYEDVETGLLHYVFRYYSPELGRWLNRDPIGEEGGINLYGMCENDPVNLFDSLGERAQVSVSTTTANAGTPDQYIIANVTITAKIHWDCAQANASKTPTLSQQKSMTGRADRIWDFTSTKYVVTGTKKKFLGIFGGVPIKKPVVEYHVTTSITASYGGNGDPKPSDADLISFAEIGQPPPSYVNRIKGDKMFLHIGWDDTRLFEHEFGHLIGAEDFYVQNAGGGTNRASVPTNDDWIRNLMSDRGPNVNWRNAEDILRQHGKSVGVPYNIPPGGVQTQPNWPGWNQTPRPGSFGGPQPSGPGSFR